MDTLAPQSVLDHRSEARSSTLVTDRLTRTLSPGGSRSSLGQEDEVVISKVSQPYRTSFSAITKPIRGRRDRSRSTSPAWSSTSSMKSDRSRSKSPTLRKLSPKHVTYDSTVTVRHSDSRDHETAVLSGDMIDPAFDPSFTEDNPKEDFTSKIREMTQLIVQEYSEQKENSDVPETKRQMGRRANRNGVANGGAPLPRKQGGPVHVLSGEYDHDRTVSYRHAISNQYSDEIQKLAQAKIEENLKPKVTVTPSDRERSSPYRERSSSVPPQQEGEDTNRLTPSKRGVGGSIGNFFRKLSPHLGRKNRKDKTGSVSSLDSEASREKRDERFSRSKVRRSFMKFLGRSKSRSGSKSGSQQGSVDDVSQDQDAGFTSPDPRGQPQSFSTSSNRILKSIEQNAITEKDVYQRFKDKQSPKSQESEIVQSRPRAMRASRNSTQSAESESNRHSNNSDKENSANKVERSVPDLVRDITPQVRRTPERETTSEDSVDSRSQPPSSLDIRRVKSPQTLQSSIVSAEGSIGECSLDANLTGSEPSLSGGGESTSSKRVVLGSRENTIDSASALSPISHNAPSVRLTSSCPDQENAKLYTHDMPRLADTAHISLPDTAAKTPSYLKLSCAVSGYGRYSQYSSYKSIEKRSPYSSCSSLHSSDPRSPDMPVTRVVSPLSRTRGSNSELGLISPQPLSNGHLSNGVMVPDSVLNRVMVPGNIANGHSHGVTYPTGDRKQDGDYFLNIIQEWENRLLSHCQNVEPDSQNPHIPEEALGKIRAAIGKANLLITQKFKQFQQLCSEHMFPSEDGKVLKWEDLQGFWDMIKIQADNVDDQFAEIELMRQNGWKELNTHSHSRGSSVSSSPKSGSLSLSNASTPAGTPGSRRKASLKPKDTPESSPERTEKMRQAAKSREEARKKMLAEKRAALKQKQKQTKANTEVEIYVAESTS